MNATTAIDLIRPVHLVCYALDKVFDYPMHLLLSKQRNWPIPALRALGAIELKERHGFTTVAACQCFRLIHTPGAVLTERLDGFLERDNNRQLHEEFQNLLSTLILRGRTLPLPQVIDDLRRSLLLTLDADKRLIPTADFNRLLIQLQRQPQTSAH